MPSSQVTVERLGIPLFQDGSAVFAHPLELGEDPRPSDHPLLAGPAHAEARARIEAAFGPIIEVPIFGEDVFAPAAGIAEPGDLLFVVSGLVRQVVVRDGRQDEPSGGRDPMVTDLYGPACFVGLAEAADPRGLDPADTVHHAFQAGAIRLALRDAKEVVESRGGLVKLDLDAPGLQLRYRSSPQLHSIHGGVAPVRLRRLRRSALAELFFGAEEDRRFVSPRRIDTLPADAFDPSTPAAPTNRGEAVDLPDAVDAIQRWLNLLFTQATTHLRHMRQQLEAAPLLQGLGWPARNALIHNGGRAIFVGPRPDDRAPCRFHEQGDPAHVVGLIERGEVELRVRQGERSAVVARQGPGELLGAGRLTPDEPEELPRHPSTAVASDGVVLTWWDRQQLRAILMRSPAAWHRLELFADPERVDTSWGLARLTVVVDESEDCLSAVLAMGAAMAMTHEHAEGPASSGAIWLVDLAGGDEISKALGGQFDHQSEQSWRLLNEADLPVLRWIGTWRPEGRLALEPHEVRVVAPVEAHEALLLVDRLRAMEGVSDVILHLPPTLDREVVWGPGGRPRIRLWNSEARAHHAPHRVSDGAGSPSQGGTSTIDRDRSASALYEVEPRLLFLESLRRIPHNVVHLNADTNLWWRITDEMPHRWIRVDHLTPRFVAHLRDRTTAFSTYDPGGDGRSDRDLSRDRPGHTPTDNLRIPWAPDSLEQLRRGGAEAAIEAGLRRAGKAPTDPWGEACWRLARMIRGCSVGLALSGGGAWGAAHIGVIRKLEEVGMPVDYVSGTSFGALVGAIYAAGGLEAVERFATLADEPTRTLRRGDEPPSDVDRLRIFLQESMAARDNPVFRGLYSTISGDLRCLGHVVEQAAGRLKLPQLPDDASASDRFRHLVACGEAVSLAELPLPFFPVASNLSEHTTHVSQWLELDLGVRIACSLPPVFPSMRVRGVAMVDGAALANVPAAEVRQRGADHVIAVNVIGANRFPRKGLATDYSAPRPEHAPAPAATGRRARLRETLGRLRTRGEPASAPRARHRDSEEDRLPSVLARAREFFEVQAWDRIEQGMAVLWLSVWKAGGDQARLHADALVDLKVEGVLLPATWRTPDVADETGAVLGLRRFPEPSVVEALHDQWSHGREDDQLPEYHRVIDPYPGRDH